MQVSLFIESQLELKLLKKELLEIPNLKTEMQRLDLENKFLKKKVNFLFFV